MGDYKIPSSHIPPNNAHHNNHIILNVDNPAAILLQVLMSERWRNLSSFWINNEYHLDIYMLRRFLNCHQWSIILVDVSARRM